jgi:hypothetical protein
MWKLETYKVSRLREPSHLFSEVNLMTKRSMNFLFLFFINLFGAVITLKT